LTNKWLNTTGEIKKKVAIVICVIKSITDT